MNKPLLCAVLFVLFIFGAGLIVIGTSAREGRRLEYLETTHRITSGFGTEADFKKLAERLVPRADKRTVRAFYGLPDVQCTELTLAGAQPETRKGLFWIYFIASPSTETSVKEARCFLVEFESSGNASTEFATLANPLPIPHP